MIKRLILIIILLYNFDNRININRSICASTFKINHTIDMIQVSGATNKDNDNLLAQAISDSLFLFPADLLNRRQPNGRHTKNMRNLLKVMPLFRGIAKDYNINLAIIIVMWVDETGWGTSYNYLTYNNFGGIKGKNTKGKSKFKSYISLHSGVQDFGRVLTLSRYNCNCNHKDYKCQLGCYKANGYWSSESALNRRINIVESYKLNFLTH